MPEGSHLVLSAAVMWNACGPSMSRQTDPLIVVEAERIAYTGHWLRRDGYAPRQF
jgi:hypothetical protein